ncbi:MAG: MFS transporter [Candidatus Lokiarchaeota archaeon]|nr:MFS transporter [Candidatus Lokiarchaeota archaeon]MBD3202574.1 MFS transporter [Candidatus Lokiarchaeota archaeon]
MPRSFKRKYYLVFFSSILGPLATNGLVPLFGQLKDAFYLDSVAYISIAFFVYMFPFAIFQLFAGTFSDVIDKRRVVFIGYIIFISGLILALLSVYINNYLIFLVAFLCQGLGFSFINPTIMAILSIITPEEKDGLIMGIYNSSAGLGVSLSAIISGLVSNWNWRYFFIINPIITFISLILFIIALKNCELLVCTPYEITDKSRNSNIKIGLITNLRKTILNFRENLKKRIIFLGFLGFACFFTVITLTNTLNEQMTINMPFLGEQEVINIVSIILTINGLISICLSPISGYLLRKMEPLIMLGIGFLLLFSSQFLPFGNSVIIFMLISFTIYLGSVFIWPALFDLSMKLNPEAKGTNSAIINSLRFLGYSFVGVFYLLVGIPIIYLVVLTLIITSLMLIILVWKKSIKN